MKSGGLARLIAEDGLRGVTSNPSIFEKAIGHGDDYDELIRTVEAGGDLDPGALFERSGGATTSSEAADQAPSPVMTSRPSAATAISASKCRPTWRWTPHGTIEEARGGCGRRVDRPNLMIKVPGDAGRRAGRSAN